MSQIVIGKSKNRNVTLDLDVLLRTRLLVQANSGGGKSWLLRRFAEQLFGKIPTIIVDPEGEFATLREKFGFVLVGKGGETPAHSRTAALVAQRLLELRVSAVCDLYELKPQERHHWVRLFLESLINAPKKLWRPTVIIVDEAHTFCPEGKSGESETSGAMVDLATRGRKRRFCAVFATQRLGKLRKDASAELLNRLIGPTFEDVDLDRAADLLSVSAHDKREFFATMRVLEPGNFFALGRAICKERLLVKVGGVATSHEIEDAKFGSEPPPAPEKVKSLLPKLADLPKEAEEKAQTEAELRTEIRSLKAELGAAKRQQTQPPAKTVADPAQAGEIKRLQRIQEQLMRFVIEVTTRNFDGSVPEKELKAAIESAVEKAMQSVRHVVNKRDAELQKLKRDAERLMKLTNAKTHVKVEVRHNEPVTVAPPKVVAPPRTPSPIARGESDEPIGDWQPNKCQRAILAVLAQFPEGCERKKLTLLSGYRWTGSFTDALGELRSKGLIVGGNQAAMQITEQGMALGPFPELPEGQALIDYWLNHPLFNLAQRKIIQALVDHPDGLTMDALLEATGYRKTGSFTDALGGLRTAGVIVGRNTEAMKLSEHLLEAAMVG